MGEAARAWVLENYVNGRVLGLTVRFYKSLLEQHHPIDARRLPIVPVDSVLNPI
jgi:hypothetical protein